MSYRELIQTQLTKMKRTTIKPHHIEAWMRMEHRTLDHLDLRQFNTAVKKAVKIIDEAGEQESEDLAKTMWIKE